MLRLQTIASALCLILNITGTQAYDTLSLTILQADNMFLKENLLLLSQTYSINEKEALILQAKAYPNPVISADFNVIDPQDEKYFNVGRDGQKQFGIEQLLVLGGKRKSGIAIARQTKSIAEKDFADLLRNLRLQVHTSFYLLLKYSTILSSYHHQLNLLDELIASYELQARRGNLPVKDVIRLKSVYLRISNNRMETQSSYLDEVRKLQVLLRTDFQIKPEADEVIFSSFRDQYSFDQLFDLAIANRPDLEVVRAGRDLAAANLKLQHQMAIPDVILNSGYDQQGGAFKNQVQFGIAVPLPLWNRNKGNIKAASYNELNAEILFQQKRTEIKAEVRNALHEMTADLLAYEKAKQLYTHDFEEVFRGINENFSRRNISILEFVDFFEAYNESLADFQRIRTQLALSAEKINYVTASHIY